MAPTNNDMVIFRMADGTEVSNDPRFDLKKAQEEMLASMPNRGDAGITEEEQKAQTQVEHAASLNSGQPGVGPNAVPEDPTKDLHGVLGSPAQRTQKDDFAEAQYQGATPKSTSVEDPDPVDSNEAVKAVREKARERYEKALAALEANDEEEGDTNEPYSEWTGKQLKAEVAKRNADGRDEDAQLKIVKGMKVADVASLLEDDDKAQAEADASSNEGPTGDPVTAGDE